MGERFFGASWFDMAMILMPTWYGRFPIASRTKLPTDVPNIASGTSGTLSFPTLLRVVWLNVAGYSLHCLHSLSFGCRSRLCSMAWCQLAFVSWHRAWLFRKQSQRKGVLTYTTNIHTQISGNPKRKTNRNKPLSWFFLLVPQV